MKAARFAYPLASLLVACGSAPPSVSSKVPPEGGTVSIADGTSVSIPAGALAQNTTIQISGEPNSVSINDVDLVGPVYRFGPEGTQFAQPVTVTLFYDPSRMPAGETASDIVIMTAAVGSSDFVPLTTAIVDARHVSTTTTHFSDFVATARKRAHEDLSAAPPDQGTLADDGATAADQSAGADGGPGDQGASIDQSPSVDQASRCPQTWDTSTCTLSANATACGGNISINCAQTICFCQGANLNRMCAKPSPYTNMVGCPPQSVVETIWTSCCGFP
jgi:hypothetical protein